MRSTHEQTVHCQNKWSYSGCVSWGVCTEISLMIISLRQHVDILEALSRSVSMLYLFFFWKFQYIVNSSMGIVESPPSAVCNPLCSGVSTHAISSLRSAMCVYVRCLAPELRSVMLFHQSGAGDKSSGLKARGHSTSSLSAYLTIIPPTSQTCPSTLHLLFSFLFFFHVFFSSFRPLLVFSH